MSCACAGQLRSTYLVYKLVTSLIESLGDPTKNIIFSFALKVLGSLILALWSRIVSLFYIFSVFLVIYCFVAGCLGGG